MLCYRMLEVKMTPQPTYEELQQYYELFRNNLPKTDLTRWLEEYILTDGLLQMARRNAKSADAYRYWEAREQAKRELRRYNFR